MQPLRDAMLAYFSQTEMLDSAGLINHLHTLGLSDELSCVLDETPSCGRPGAQPAEAEAGWWHFYGLMHRDGLEHAVQTARENYEGNPDDADALSRFNALCQAAFRLRRGEQSDADQDADTFYD